VKFVAAIARRSDFHVRIGYNFGGEVNIGNFELRRLPEYGRAREGKQSGPGKP
jgi:hypothetical protein